MASERVMVSRLPPIGSMQAELFSPRHSKKYDGLNGPSYTLGRQPVKYILPPPSVLKPHQDTKAGGLETWPAHATAQTHSSTSAVLNKDKQLVLINEEAQGKPQMVPKPRFLDQLETFLKKELKSLGVDTVEPNELRLQAHREVFEYLIEDFKTYKPLLSAIKNEYEMMLSHQRGYIRHLEPLKQMLVTVSEQCDQKIMALREEEKDEMVEIRNENKKLFQRIDGLKEQQFALEAQVERLQEELAVEYLRYRDECDARKLLIADINDLRYQQEDEAARKSMQEAEEQKDDPLMLKLALKQAREDEAAATKRLNEMEANYGDVIPRRDYETLQKEFQDLQDNIEESKKDFVKMQQDHETLMGTYKQVLQERDDYYYEYENLRSKALTPRPDWEKVSEFVPGGAARWNEISEGKKSNELVDVLLQEIAGGGSDGTLDYFEGQGTEDTVPKYLQYEGQVRNRRLGKRDTALFIRELWKDKAVHDSQKTDGQREKMAEFLHQYLKQRFSLGQMVVEWGYNLHDACQRYSNDDRIGLFWNILTGEAEEELYYQPLQMIAKMLNHLTRIDLDKGNPGTLGKEELKGALQEFFSGKDYNFLGITEENLAALIKGAETELDAKGGEALDYKNLFLEDDEGRTGPFLEEFKRQQKEQRQQYVDAIKDQLKDTNPVTSDDLHKAVQLVDAHIKRADIDTYVLAIFRVADKDKLQEAEPLEQEDVIRRLLLSNVRKHTQFE